MRPLRSLQFTGYALMALLCVLLGLSGVVQAAPVAGASIHNQATAQYDDPQTLNNKIFATSNTTIVNVVSANLTPAPLMIVGPGTPVTWCHSLTNTGSLADSYALTVADLGGDSGILNSLTLVEDTNGNCVEDAGDRVVANGGTVTVKIGRAHV